MRTESRRYPPPSDHTHRIRLRRRTIYGSYAPLGDTAANLPAHTFVYDDALGPEVPKWYDARHLRSIVFATRSPFFLEPPLPAREPCPRGGAASLGPIAMACLQLLTFLRDPDRSASLIAARARPARLSARPASRTFVFQRVSWPLTLRGPRFAGSVSRGTVAKARSRAYRSTEPIASPLRAAGTASGPRP